ERTRTDRGRAVRAEPVEDPVEVLVLAPVRDGLGQPRGARVVQADPEPFVVAVEVPRPRVAEIAARGNERRVLVHVEPVVGAVAEELSGGRERGRARAIAEATGAVPASGARIAVMSAADAY